MGVSAHEYYGTGYQDIQMRVPAIASARKHLGWAPSTDLDTAIRKTIEYYVAQGTNTLPILADAGARPLADPMDSLGAEVA